MVSDEMKREAIERYNEMLRTGNVLDWLEVEEWLLAVADGQRKDFPKPQKLDDEIINELRKL